MEGSPIRRIGYVSWLRNLAVGLGNARRARLAQQLDCELIDAALCRHLQHPSDIVREHVSWALRQGA